MNYKDFRKSIEQKKLHAIFGETPEVKNHSFDDQPYYALKTSGSTTSKIFVHSLSSIMASVEAFTQIHPLASEDKWGLCLSTKHVAGFSILARSHFAGLKAPHVFNWSAQDLLKKINDEEITILSLVPTQIYDIVSKGFLAPETLKYLFVGGASLEHELYKKALELGWPVVPCYGSTETFAQMSSSVDGQCYKPYPGWETDLNQKGELLLQGPSLFEGQIIGNEFFERLEKSFNTKDLGRTCENGLFEVLGKSNGLIKIKGSYFDFNSFKRDFLKTTSAVGFKSSDLFPVVLEEKRAGGGVYLVCTQKNINFDEVLKDFKMIRGVFYIQSTKFLSEIGKVSRAKLEDALSKPVLSL